VTNGTPGDGRLSKNEKRDAAREKARLLREEQKKKDRRTRFILQGSIILGLFNLIPIPPLDGGTILFSYLPPRTAWQWRPVLTQYGFFLIILLILPLFGNASILGRVIVPIVDAVYGVLVG